MQSGPGFIPTFLYYFVGTTLIVVFVISKGLDAPELADAIGNPFRVGILLGLFAGGLGAYLNSHDTAELPIKNRGAFLKKLNDTLTKMGYTEAEAIDGVQLYKRSFPSSLFSSRIVVNLENNQATIGGRASSIRKLQKRLDT